MPHDDVAVPRSDVSAAQAQWTRCRDVFAGQDAVKARGTHYLPRPDGQSVQQYAAYLQRAPFFGAYRRTIAASAGALFRKPPVILAPPALVPLLDDVALSEAPLSAFALQLVTEVLVVGRAGVLIDFSGAAGRPYAVRYGAEQIINWRLSSVPGDRRLTMLVLAEHHDVPDPQSPFRSVPERRFRVCEVVDGVYLVTIWREHPIRRQLVADDPIVPTRRGQPLDRIPFVFLGPTAISPQIERPPLLDLADTNLNRYRLAADHSHALHFVGMPTVYATGIDPQTTTLHIGPSMAWMLPAGATAGILEFRGAGLGALEKALAEQRDQMASLGARMLDAPGGPAETATGIALRLGAEHATLKTIAQAVSAGLTNILWWLHWWVASPEASREQLDAIDVQLNQDFVSTQLAPGLLSELTKALQEGAISKETYYHALEQGEVTIPGRTFREEQHAIMDDLAADHLPDEDDDDEEEEEISV